MEIINLIVLSVSWSLYFLFIAANVPSDRPLILVAVPGLVSSLFLFGLCGGLRSVRSFISSSWRDKSMLLLASFLGLFSFQMLQLIKRYGYAPPLTDIVLILCLVPLFTYIVSLIVRDERFELWTWVAIVFALLGTVATVGNWEKPSSLVPFAKFPLEESLIVLAAMSWSIATVIIFRLKDGLKRDGAFPFVLFSTIIAFILLIATDGFEWVKGVGYTSFWSFLVMGIFLTLLYFTLFRLLIRSNPLRSAVSIMAFPIVLTAMHTVDLSIGLWGQSPFKLGQVLTGLLMVSTGIALIAFRHRLERLNLNLGSSWLRTGWVVAIMSLASFLMAVIALFRPQIEIDLGGVLEGGKHYQGLWTLYPYQTLLGALLLFSSGIIFISVLISLTGNGRKLSVLGALVPGIGVVSALVVGSTPYVNWTSTVPPEILHAIGTEYVTVRTLDFLSLRGINIAAIVSLALLAISVLGLICLFVFRTIVQDKSSLL